MLVYLESDSNDPMFNLALEQYVFDALPQENEYFMLWQNAPSVIVGKHQNTSAEVNAAYVKDHGIQVVRRLSGGGAVYHDLGGLNFTFVMNAGDTGRLDLNLFCQPVAQALRALGAPAEVNGRNDITVDGKKISGNAQYLRSGRVMHHGTILFDSDLTVVSQALTVSADKLESKGIRSVSSRVTNVKPFLPPDVTLAQFKSRLLSAIFMGMAVDRHALTAQDLAAVERLRAQRYATWEWNWGASPACSVAKRRRVEGCGTVELFLDTDRGRITALAFRGDFFSAEEPDGLAARLLGRPLEERALGLALADVDVGRYFTGLTREGLVALLVG